MQSVTCLMPTFNRYPLNSYLVEEAVESFLRQDYPNRELIICNDAPGQTLAYACNVHPRVRVYNMRERFPTLGDKLRFMIAESSGELLCRWDDDDISLPHRLSLSVAKLGDKLEWHPRNYWYDPCHLIESSGHGNSHVTAIFRKELLKRFDYPVTHSGCEDQQFNQLLKEHNIEPTNEMLPQSEMFYLYRWGTGGQHLSGVGGNTTMQAFYEKLGNQKIATDTFEIKPQWHRNHLFRAMQACEPKQVFDLESVGHYFDYAAYYDEVISKAPMNSTVVEVGCLHGKSLIYLARAAKKHGKRINVVGVDLGCGANSELSTGEETESLINTIKRSGDSDYINLIVAESTRAASLFADGSLYFVFIDANHAYQHVLADLQAWYRKIAPGGEIGGHDYTAYHLEVVSAVNSFFRAENLGAYGSCWRYRKPT